MDNKYIIRMAREAGAEATHYETWGDVYEFDIELLERFAALVIAHAKSEQINLAYQQGYEEGSAHERDACAKVCDDEIKSYMSKQYTTDPLGGYRERFAAEQCAAAIRARSEK